MSCPLVVFSHCDHLLVKYIYDADEDIQGVEVLMGYLKLGADVSQNDRKILRDMFYERISRCNLYVQHFQLAKYIDLGDDTSLVFHPYVPAGSHARFYNTPTHELCVRVTDIIKTKYHPIILRRNTMYLESNPSITELQIIHYCHSLYELIQYLVFSPDGGEGWHPN